MSIKEIKIFGNIFVLLEITSSLLIFPALSQYLNTIISVWNPMAFSDTKYSSLFKPEDDMPIFRFISLSDSSEITHSKENHCKIRDRVSLKLGIMHISLLQAAWGLFFTLYPIRCLSLQSVCTPIKILFLAGNDVPIYMGLQKYVQGYRKVLLLSVKEYSEQTKSSRRRRKIYSSITEVDYY